MTQWCNPYGGESSGPDQVKMLGGLDERHPTTNWFCSQEAVHRFRMVCEHGHWGKIVPLCEDHWKSFQHVVFCPRCNIPGKGDHQCKVSLIPVS